MYFMAFFLLIISKYSPRHFIIIIISWVRLSPLGTAVPVPDDR
jgi:hypothetical protein